MLQDKEGLMTELRKELRVSDDEHREVLSKVNNDDIIGRLRLADLFVISLFYEQNIIMPKFLLLK